MSDGSVFRDPRPRGVLEVIAHSETYGMNIPGLAVWLGPSRLLSCQDTPEGSLALMADIEALMEGLGRAREEIHQRMVRRILAERRDGTS